MIADHADQIVQDYVRETGLDLTGAQMADLSFILRGYDVIQTGLHNHVVVGSLGEPETRTVPVTLSGFLAELTGHYR